MERPPNSWLPVPAPHSWFCLGMSGHVLTLNTVHPWCRISTLDCKPVNTACVIFKSYLFICRHSHWHPLASMMCRRLVLAWSRIRPLITASLWTQTFTMPSIQSNNIIIIIIITVTFSDLLHLITLCLYPCIFHIYLYQLPSTFDEILHSWLISHLAAFLSLSFFCPVDDYKKSELSNLLSYFCIWSSLQWELNPTPRCRYTALVDIQGQNSELKKDLSPFLNSTWHIKVFFLSSTFKHFVWNFPPEPHRKGSIT